MEKSIFSDEYQHMLHLLRSAREAAGLTQGDVGLWLGQTQSFVSKCERGERRLDVVELMHFCDALSVDFPAFAVDLHKRKK